MCNTFCIPFSHVLVCSMQDKMLLMDGVDESKLINARFEEEIPT